MKKGIYEDKGVKLSKQACKLGETVELIYNGLLKNSGATELKAHIGYNEAWDDSQTIEMEPKNDGFAVSLTLTKEGSLNCAFVDPSGNWDNNSGENYSFKVSKAAVSKPRAAKTPDAKVPSKKKAAINKPVAEKPEVKELSVKAPAAKVKKASEAKESNTKKAKKEASTATAEKKTKAKAKAKSSSKTTKTVKSSKEKK